MTHNFDLAVIGSGFAGSLMAMIARRLGRSVVLLERGTHPRFAIGESSTPLANLLLEELAHRYDLPRLAPLSKWGSWQRAYPEIGCGLKRGFTFYHHKFDKPFAADPERRDQLLVGASPSDEIADTHWYRPDFDHFLVREAQALGVDYRDNVNLSTVAFDNDGATLQIEQSQAEVGSDHRADRAVVPAARPAVAPYQLRARFVIDATGPRGFLHRALNLRKIPFKNLPPTQALFSHFTGVRRLEEMGSCNVGQTSSSDLLPETGRRGRLPHIETPPYPVDDAAVHHVFDGGWVWVLRFNNGITSAGVAATDKLANELRFAEGAPAWARLLARLPTVREQLAGAQATLPFVHVPRLSFRSGAVVGERWALLPSAAGFVDPLLSTGFPLTLLGVSRLAEAMEHDWDATRLNAYAVQTTNELLAAERLVASLYATMNDFPTFTALSLLYFTAMIYSETARREGRPELARSFLLCDDPLFGPAMRRCCAVAALGKRGADERGEFERLPRLATAATDLAASSDVIEEVRRAIAPFDLAGLGDASRRNWHPFVAVKSCAARPPVAILQP